MPWLRLWPLVHASSLPISSRVLEDGMNYVLISLCIRHTSQHRVPNSARNLKTLKQKQTLMESFGSSASLGRFLSGWPFTAKFSGGSLRRSFIYYVHNSLWNMKAQDKVLTLKAATAHCVDKAEAPENVHKQE